MRCGLGLPLLLAGALAAGEGEQPMPASPPPVLGFTASSMNMSMSPDRPSQAVGVRIRYEAVRLECERLSYSMSALAGVSRPVLTTAELIGGPDGHVLFDSTASQLPQMAFHGVLRPAKLSIRRLDQDPDRPTEVRFRAEANELGDVSGLIVTPAGPRRHVAWADRAVLEFVCTAAAQAAAGLDAPRLVALHFYGRAQPARPATVLRLKPDAPAEPTQVEPLLAARAYDMRAAGEVISMYFDDAGALETIGGISDFEGDPQVPIRASSIPKLGK